MLVKISKQYPETAVILMLFKVLNTALCLKMVFEAVVELVFISTVIF